MLQLALRNVCGAVYSPPQRVTETPCRTDQKAPALFGAHAGLVTH